jgi:hypothetical protein
LRNDARAQTLSGRGSADLDLENSGRFSKPHTVIGTTAGPPEYPAGPNWSADPTGVEPPLGYAIDQHEAVGEPSEIERSLAGAPADASVTPISACDAEAPTRDTFHDVVEAPAIPNPNPKGRLP